MKKPKKRRKLRHRSPIPPPGRPMGKKGYNRKVYKKTSKEVIEDYVP